MICGDKDEENKKKIKSKIKPKEIKVFIDKELEELNLSKVNRTKLIKAILSATMNTKQYDIT